MVTNAKEELLQFLTYRELNLEEVFDGAVIRFFPEWIEHPAITFQPNQLDRFLDYLDGLNYDSGYGTQELFGFVLLKCGAPNRWWLDRHEYDGSESWVLRKRPRL